MNARIRQPGQDRTDKIAVKVTEEQDRQKWTGRKGMQNKKAEQTGRIERQNKTGRKGKSRQGCQEARAGQPGEDS
jgi:hypothetical protein